MESSVSKLKFNFSQIIMGISIKNSKRVLQMDPMMVEALRNALNEVDFSAAAMAEDTVAVWKDDAPANAHTMTRSKLRKSTKKKKAWMQILQWLRCGVHQSYEEAIKWFEKATGQGHGVAQSQMGFM